MDDRDSVSMWIDLSKEGDAVAQQALWERFFPRLVELARRRLKSERTPSADEEDVVLSVFDSYFGAARQKRFPDLRDRDDLWRLLSRMTHRKVIDLIRHNRRQKRRILGESAIRGAGHDAEHNVMAEHCDSKRPPDLEFIFTEECRRLLGMLNDTLRTTALRRLDGYKNREIAEMHDCSLATVERQLKMIREIWREQSFE